MKIVLLVFLFIFSASLAKAQVVAVQNDSCNFARAGMTNPLIIAVEGYPSSALVVTTNNGTITGSNGHYVVIPATADSACTIRVSVKTKGHLKEVKILKMPVECLKIDGAYFMGRVGGKISLEDAKKGIALAPYVEGYEWDPPASITHCTVIVIRDGKEFFNKTLTNETGVRFTDTEMANMIKNLKTGDKLQFKNLLYRTVGGCKGSFAPMGFIIN